MKILVGESQAINLFFVNEKDDTCAISWAKSDILRQKLKY